MPVEAEHAAERLEPERIGEAAQHVARAEFAREIDRDLARETDHSPEAPRGRLAAVQRERRVAGVTAHIDEPIPRRPPAAGRAPTSAMAPISRESRRLRPRS